MRVVVLDERLDRRRFAEQVADRDAASNFLRMVSSSWLYAAAFGAETGSLPVGSSSTICLMFSFASASACGVPRTSFAALRDEGDARQLASRIDIDGERARVVPSSVAGTAIFRVVMGPFRSREDAERRGRASGRDFWVYSGAP